MIIGFCCGCTSFLIRLVQYCNGLLWRFDVNCGNICHCSFTSNVVVFYFVFCVGINFGIQKINYCLIVNFNKFPRTVYDQPFSFNSSMSLNIFFNDKGIIPLVGCDIVKSYQNPSDHKRKHTH